MHLKRLDRKVEGELGRYTDLLKRAVPQAREALKQLLVDRVTFTPVKVQRGKQTHAFRGELSYGAVLRNICVVAPTGFEPVFQP